MKKSQNEDKNTGRFTDPSVVIIEKKEKRKDGDNSVNEYKKRREERLKARADEFKEGDHPRDENGRFVSSGGGVSLGKAKGRDKALSRTKEYVRTSELAEDVRREFRSEKRREAEVGKGWADSRRGKAVKSFETVVNRIPDGEKFTLTPKDGKGGVYKFKKNGRRFEGTYVPTKGEKERGEREKDLNYGASQLFDLYTSKPNYGMKFRSYSNLKKTGRYDSVDAFRRRRSKRIVDRYDSQMTRLYGVAIGMGIKGAEEMSPSELIDALRGKGFFAKKNNGMHNKKSMKKTSEEYEKSVGYTGKGKMPKVKGMESNEVRKVMSGCNRIGKGHYDKASEVANDEKNTFLWTFTTHGEDHVKQVVEKTNQAADVIENLKHEPFKGANIDRKTMLVSAWFHDTGMDGGEMDWSGDNGDGIRANHAVNSAMHILEHGDEIEKEFGVNPSHVAFIAFAHTKSMSGIGDLSNPEHWKEGLDRVEDAVNKYNDRNSGNKIKFDRDSIFGGEPTKDNIRDMAAQVAALRLGDANREANIPLRSQSGGEYKIDKKPSRNCMSKDAEIAESVISITDKGGRHELSDNDPKMSKVKGRNFSKGVVLGERNMVKVDAAMDEKHGTLREDITLENGNDVPFSTVEALLERCGELNTINGVPRAIKVKLTGVKSVNDVTPNAERAYFDVSRPDNIWNIIQNKRKVNKKTGVEERPYEGIADVVYEFDDGSTYSMREHWNNVSWFNNPEKR